MICQCSEECLSVVTWWIMSSLPVLQEVDVEVDGAVEGGEEVAGARDVGEPAWPAQLRLQ